MRLRRGNQADRIGSNDDFFALGGHSLLATQVMAKLRATHQIDFSLPAILEASKIVALPLHAMLKNISVRAAA